MEKKCLNYDGNCKKRGEICVSSSTPGANQLLLSFFLEKHRFSIHTIKSCSQWHVKGAALLSLPNVTPRQGDNVTRYRHSSRAESWQQCHSGWGSRLHLHLPEYIHLILDHSSNLFISFAMFLVFI